MPHCDNPNCENEAVKEVPVTVSTASDDTRSYCAACEAAYAVGVQQGAHAGFGRGAYIGTPSALLGACEAAERAERLVIRRLSGAHAAEVTSRKLRIAALARYRHEAGQSEEKGDPPCATCRDGIEEPSMSLGWDCRRGDIIACPRLGFQFHTPKEKGEKPT